MVLRIEDEDGSVRIIIRAQSRDWHGRFAGSGGGGPSGEVRGSLRDAAATGNPSRVSRAAAAEAKRITGRDIPFDFGNSDPLTAAEHSEGVLRGLERFPGAKLDRVSVGNTGNAWAHVENGNHIVFSSTDSSTAGRADYLATIRESSAGWSKGPQVYGINTLKVAAFHVRGADTPTSVGLHEFGHVVHLGGTSTIPGLTRDSIRVRTKVDDLVRTSTRNERRRTKGSFPGSRVVDSRDMVHRSVSSYALTNHKELIAEAFTDVMINGSGASALSQGIYKILETEVNG